MDAPSTPPPQPATPQTPANLNAPQLPAQPEKLLPAGRGNSVGALVGIIIIILVLIVGAFYFWGAKLAEEEQSGFIPEESSAEETAE